MVIVLFRMLSPNSSGEDGNGSDSELGEDQDSESDPDWLADAVQDEDENSSDSGSEDDGDGTQVGAIQHGAVLPAAATGAGAIQHGAVLPAPPTGAGAIQHGVVLPAAPTGTGAIQHGAALPVPAQQLDWNWSTDPNKRVKGGAQFTPNRAPGNYLPGGRSPTDLDEADLFFQFWDKANEIVLVETNRNGAACAAKAAAKAAAEGKPPPPPLGPSRYAGDGEVLGYLDRNGFG